MIILQIFLLSSLFTFIFISLHFLSLYIFSFSKTVQQIIVPFILSNLICFYFVKDFEIYNFFYDSFIINITILIIYGQFVNIINKGFTLSIITSFKKKKKLFHNELIKNYANGKGAKWILLNRLKILNKLKIIKLNKRIVLNPFGHFLSIILIFLRKILAVKDFG